MLEGHVLRELLTPDIKLTQFFSIHEIFHGVTAPGFLFSAGFTFAIATQRKWDQVTAFTAGFFRKTWRAVMLILVGYALHFPFLSLHKTIVEATKIQWNEFLIFDVLQCIGIGLLLMRLLLVVIRRERPFVWILILMLLAVVYTTPLFWGKEIILPLVISSAINGLNGSPFPLFPYCGFMLAGTCVSWLFLRSAQKGNEIKFIKILMASGLAIVIISVIADKIPVKIYSENTFFWATSPNYFWIRLGILFLMLSGLWYAEDFFAVKGRSIAWMPKWLTILGVESLFVYIVHLVILFGWVINPDSNLQAWFSGNLNIIQSLLVFSGLTFIMVILSLGWNYLKKRHHVLAVGILWWMGFCIGWSFFINPY